MEIINHAAVMRRRRRRFYHDAGGAGVVAALQGAGLGEMAFIEIHLYYASFVNFREFSGFARNYCN